MSTITKEKIVTVTQYDRFIKCNYCGKTEPKQKVTTKLVNWATIVVQTEFNSFFHSDICPKCILKKGIKTNNGEE